MEKLNKLVAEYLEQFPKEETPLNGFNAFGGDGLIEILENREGKKIEWIIDPERLDWQDFKYTT